MIVLTAPTGNIGSKLLSSLLAGPEPIRVIARDPAKLPEGARSMIEVIEGSHGDAEVVNRAFEGARAVFWLVPADPAAASAYDAYVGFSRPGAAAIKRFGIEQVVSISAIGRGWPTDAGHVTATVALDDLLAGSGAALRGLQCASLMENVLRQAAVIRDKASYYWPTPADLPTRHVASKDVAAVAASLLQDQRWTGFEEVPLLGPEDLTHAEMMAIASQVVGKTIAYHQMSMADLHAMMLSRGASAGMADAMVNMMTAKNEGIDDTVQRTPALSALTPTTFRTWCEDVLKPAVA